MEPKNTDQTPENQPTPGIQTSEFKVASSASLALLIPIIQSVLTKTGDTRFEVACLTVVAVSYMWVRAFVKR